MTRILLFGLLAVVAMAAAVLSFAALRDLGLACGFDPRLAWLVPVVLDAGAAAGSVTWLSSPPGLARVFGRRLALVLLTSSVAGNAVAHLLEAYHLTAAWWLVVAVSAMAPAILGATIHLAVVTVQGDTDRPEQAVETTRQGSPIAGTPAVEDGVGSTETLDAPARFPVAGTVGGIHDPGTPAPGSSLVQVGEFFPEPGETLVCQGAAGDHLDQRGAGAGGETASTLDNFADLHKVADLDSTDGPTVGPVGPTSTDGQGPAVGAADVRTTDAGSVGLEPTVDRAAELIADGIGRRRLARELGISEYEARQLMGSRVNGNGARS